MVKETQVDAITGLVNEVIAGDPDIFLVEVKVKPTNNVKVFLDGDSGISIGRCADFNRALYKRMEESQIFQNGDFSLEVSSPGLDEPLKLDRQYRKNIGRDVEVTTIDGTQIAGRLKAKDSEALTIEGEKGKNKKKEVVVHTIPLNNIKSTKIQIKF